MKYFNEDTAVGRLSEIVALACGVHPVTARQIRTAAALHDIGKQKIPQSLLNKPGKLTGQELELVKTHTILGAEMLASIKNGLGDIARTITLYHHEWYNGGGYWGRRTCELPFYVSVVAISDVFVALISERSYKEAWLTEEAIDYIQNQAGLQFNPLLIKLFVPLVRSDSRIRDIFRERRVM